jgi:hypothetical protein
MRANASGNYVGQISEEKLPRRHCGQEHADEPEINKVFKSPEGYWMLDDNRATGGFCAITYVTPAYLAGLWGGGADPKDTFWIFNGPTIPGTKTEKRRQMTITGADGLAQTTQAIHAPDPVHKEMGTIIFRMASIQSAIDGMTDLEHVTIVMDKKQVFSMKWKGGYKARAAMQKCVGANARAAGAE